MAETQTIEAQPRSAVRKQNKALRRSGQVPLNLYGFGQVSVPLEMEEKALRRVLQHATASSIFHVSVGGKQHNVMFRQVQKHPVSGSLIHVDLLEVRMDQMMRLRLPVVFHGEAPAVKLLNAMVQHLVDGLNVEGLPSDLPHNIQVDVSELTELDQAIHVKDISLGPNVRILDDPEDMIVKISATRGAEAEPSETPGETVVGTGAAETPESEEK